MAIDQRHKPVLYSSDHCIVGCRLRHEKLVAQQRHLLTSRDTSAHAYQSLQYFDLAEPPKDVEKPDPRSQIDDGFAIAENNEEVDA